MVVSGGSGVLYGVVGGSLGCFGLALLVYNAVALFKYLREDTTEKASTMAIAAFALGVVSICGGCFLAWLPCVLANIERKKIYREESSLRSTGLVRAASLTSGVVCTVSILGMLTAIFVQFASGAGAPATTP